MVIETLKEKCIGVDIGGTHITAAAINMELKTIIKDEYFRDDVTAGADARTIIRQWAATIKKAAGSNIQTGAKIGIAMPGPMDYENGICYIKGQGKYESLYGLNVKEMLAHELNLEQATIIMFNDAACFLQGEVFGGSAKNVDKAIGITLGTGLGSAVYNNGIAKDADLWRMPFKNSILEEYLSSRWFLGKYFELTGMHIKNVKELKASASEKILKEIFTEFAENLALFLQSFINMLNPDCIVLGGNIANGFALFEDPLKQLSVPVYVSSLGEDAMLLGAVGSFQKAR